MPLGAVGTVRVKPPSTAVALKNKFRSLMNVCDGGEDLRGKDWAGDGDESSVDLRFSIGSGDDGARGQKGDLRAGGDVAVRGRGSEHWESLRKSG